jgi:hypothetical protein
MRWLTILAMFPISIFAQAWTADDLDSALQAGRASPRFNDMVNLYASFSLDQARETRVVNIQSQLGKLRAMLQTLNSRQEEIREAISTRKFELSGEEIEKRQADAFTELQDISKRLDYLVRITKWIQSGGTFEPGLSLDELEASPPSMQSMEELRALVVKAARIQARLANPSAMCDEELASYLLVLREEQAALKAKVQPLTEAIALLEAKLQEVSAQPLLLSSTDRDLVSVRSDKIRATIAQ